MKRVLIVTTIAAAVTGALALHRTPEIEKPLPAPPLTADVATLCRLGMAEDQGVADQCPVEPVLIDSSRVRAARMAWNQVVAAECHRRGYQFQGGLVNEWGNFETDPRCVPTPPALVGRGRAQFAVEYRMPPAPVYADKSAEYERLFRRTARDYLAGVERQRRKLDALSCADGWPAFCR